MYQCFDLKIWRFENGVKGLMYQFFNVSMYQWLIWKFENGHCQLNAVHWILTFLTLNSELWTLNSLPLFLPLLFHKRFFWNEKTLGLLQGFNLKSWSHLGSNQGPPDYESGALTNWAIGPFGFSKLVRQNKIAKLRACLSKGRCNITTYFITLQAYRDTTQISLHYFREAATGSNPFLFSATILLPPPGRCGCFYGLGEVKSHRKQPVRAYAS